MEKYENSQLELFSQTADSGEFKPRSANTVLSRIWGYEKAILITIGILAVVIVAFSLGVERGKSMVLLEKVSPVVVQPQSQPQPQVDAVVKKTVVIQAAVPNVTEQNGGYTIQVASFKTRTYALKEAEILKKKGLTTMILPKGSYTVLCVGSFPSKEAAQGSLVELNKRYKNCQIRRL